MHTNLMTRIAFKGSQIATSSYQYKNASIYSVGSMIMGHKRDL